MASEKRRRRLRLAEAQNWRCAYCLGEMHMDGTRLDGATIEHLTPKSLGGDNRAENLVSACKACNMARSGFYSPHIFRRMRLHQLLQGRWPCTTAPSRPVRRFLYAVFAEAEAAKEAELAAALLIVMEIARRSAPERRTRSRQ